MKESGKLQMKWENPLKKLTGSNPLKKEKPQAAPVQETEEPESKSTGFFEVVRILGLAVYRLRSVFMAIPVVYAALRIAAYNSEHLPLLVGLNMQTTGEFAKTISRQNAVTLPLFLTGGCIALMFFSRKPIYPWLISIFSLAIPVLLLVTNTILG